MMKHVWNLLPISRLPGRKSYRRMKTISYLSPTRRDALINITFACVKDRRKEYINNLSHVTGVLLNVKHDLNTRLVNTIRAAGIFKIHLLVYCIIVRLVNALF